MDVAAPVHFDTAFQDQLELLFRWRRDERHFCRDPLPDGMLQDLLRIADMAPSVGNAQPWRFVRVSDVDRRGAVAANFRAANAAALAAQPADRAAAYARLKLEGLEQAPEHLAVFVETEPEQGAGLGRRTMPETLAYSAVAAIQTLWLAARARGIGVGWVSILTPDQLSEDLDVPSEWLFVAYLCIGYPKQAHEAPELERVGWQERTALETRVVER